jgi:hypothetical protein
VPGGHFIVVTFIFVLTVLIFRDALAFSGFVPVTSGASALQIN